MTMMMMKRDDDDDNDDANESVDILTTLDQNWTDLSVER